jgi:hypothetical protein
MFLPGDMLHPTWSLFAVYTLIKILTSVNVSGRASPSMEDRISTSFSQPSNDLCLVRASISSHASRYGRPVCVSEKLTDGQQAPSVATSMRLAMIANIKGGRMCIRRPVVVRSSIQRSIHCARLSCRPLIGYLVQMQYKTLIEYSHSILLLACFPYWCSGLLD